MVAESQLRTELAFLPKPPETKLTGYYACGKHGSASILLEEIGQDAGIWGPGDRFRAGA